VTAKDWERLADMVEAATITVTGLSDFDLVKVVDAKKLAKLLREAAEEEW
jgi:hypothetical protein